MAQQKLPNVPSPRTTVYDNLLGVDFRSDQTEVERRRSPMMVNMISDLGGNPIKRDGYRKVSDRGYLGIVNASGKAYGIRWDEDDNDAQNDTLIVVPISLDETTHLMTEDSANKVTLTFSADYNNTVHNVWSYQNSVYISMDESLCRVDVVKKTSMVTGIHAMSSSAIGSSAPLYSDLVPLSIIGLDPNGTGQYSSVYYGKNILSIYQTFSYKGNGSDKTYKIPMYAKMGYWAKVEIMDANGVWQTQNSGYTIGTGSATTETAWSLDGTTTGSFSVTEAKIVFATAPASPPVSGEDNVRITVAPFSTEQIKVTGDTAYNKGYYNEYFPKLVQSDAHIFFNSRLFLEAGERAYYSEVNSPFIMPDNNYFEVGGDIASFQHVSNSIIIITSGKDDETIFLASPVESALLSGLTAAFSVRTANASVGAISSNVGGVLNDEPMFLSATGIYGLLTNWTSEKYAVNRSGRVNRRLCKEHDLEAAVGCSFNGYYYLAINGQMYVLDGRHKDNMRSGETSYECYYFDSMPDIKRMFVAGGRMYFTDGTITYTWNSDLTNDLRYYDYLTLEDGERTSGLPVAAYWASVFDDDGMPQILKTLKKKGSMAVMTPATHTGCYVRLLKNGDEIQDLGYQATSIFTFDDVSFETDEFSFEGNEVAYDRFTKKKIKKYKRLQIIVGNDRAEPFALTKVVKTYEVGNYAKR